MQIQNVKSRCRQSFSAPHLQKKEVVRSSFLNLLGLPYYPCFNDDLLSSSYCNKDNTVCFTWFACASIAVLACEMIWVRANSVVSAA